MGKVADKRKEYEALFIAADDAGNTEDAKAFLEALTYWENQPEQEDYSEVNAQEQGEQNYAGGLAETALKGATMNLSDEAQGAVAAIFTKHLNNLLGNTSFGQSLGMQENLAPSGITGETAPEGWDMYEGARDISRAEQKQFAAENPKTALATEIASSMVLPGAVTGKMLQAPSVTAKITGAPLLFAGEGAISGFGAGEGMENSGLQALQQGTTSAVVGTTLNKLGKMGMNKLNARKAKRLQEASQKTTTLDDLNAAAGKAYSVADDSALMIKKSGYSSARDDILRDMVQEGYSPKSNAGIDNAYKALSELDGEVTVQELMSIRKMANNAVFGSGQDQTQSAIVKKGIRKIFDSLKKRTNALGEDVPSPHVKRFIGDGSEEITRRSPSMDDIVNGMDEGDTLFNRYAQGKKLKQMDYRADLSPNENYDTAIKGEAKSLLFDDKKRLGVDKEIITGLEDLIHGNQPGKHLARSLAAVSPSEKSARGPLAAASGAFSGGVGGVGIGTVLSGGNPVGGGIGLILGALGVPILGGVGEKFATKMSRSEMDRLINLAVNKGQKSAVEYLAKMGKKYLIKGKIGPDLLFKPMSRLEAIGSAAGTIGSNTTLRDLATENIELD